MSDGRFEQVIHGLFFKNDRLKELQQKSIDKGLRGDEVFEFIHLDRKELVDEIDELKAEIASALGCIDNIFHECSKFYGMEHPDPFRVRRIKTYINEWREDKENE